MTTCPVCGKELELGESTVRNELFECSDCGTELEVTEVNPLEVKEAPKEEEDWGQ